jgi:hypothetical protein
MICSVFHRAAAPTSWPDWWPAKLGESAKWTIVADNRAGAGGTIGIAEAAKSAPTGYDMVMGQKDNMVVGPGCTST